MNCTQDIWRRITAYTFDKFQTFGGLRRTKLLWRAIYIEAMRKIYVPVSTLNTLYTSRAAYTVIFFPGNMLQIKRASAQLNNNLLSENLRGENPRRTALAAP